MSDKERLDWLDKKGNELTCSWNPQDRYRWVLRRRASTGYGETFRDALDSLIRDHDRIMSQRW